MTWSDIPPEGPQFNSEIYFQRFSEDLVPLDAAPHRITFSDPPSRDPSLVWADGEWALSWSEDFVEGYHEIAFARLDALGNLIDPPGIVQITFGADQPGGWNKQISDIEWTGQEYGVFYLEQSLPMQSSGDLYMARVSALGTHLGTDAILTPGAAKNALFFDAAWNGTDYGVAWQKVQVLELTFGRMGCNCADADGDGFSSCAGGDCDDTRFDVNLGRPELCGDGIDNNCDTLADCRDTTTCPPQGPGPGDVSGLEFEADKATLTWPAVAGADRYDVARGLLTELQYDQGARNVACLEPDAAAPAAFDAEVPVQSEAFYYLVRAEAGSPAACLQGSWGPPAARDTTITACP